MTVMIAEKMEMMSTCPQPVKQNAVIVMMIPKNRTHPAPARL